MQIKYCIVICCVVAMVPMCSLFGAGSPHDGLVYGVGVWAPPSQHRQQSFSPLVGGLVAAAGLWLVLAMNLR